MKKIFKNKKSRIIFILVLVVVIALAVVLVLKLNDKGTKVETTTVAVGDVSQYYDTTGTLSSSSTEKYYAYVGVVAKTVNVAPGDTVCKGDVLATFDTSAMNSLVEEKKTAYDNAVKTYNNAVQSENTAAEQAKKLEEQLQSSGVTTTATTTSSSNSQSMVEVYKQSMESAKAAYDAIVNEKATLDNGLVATADGKVTDVYVKVGEAYKVVADESSTIDISSLLGESSSSSSSSVDVSSLASALSSSSTQSASKGVAIVVDYYDGYTVDFSLGKYDLQTIKVGMPATISYTDYEYKGEVSYISATASSTTNIVSSMMGSDTSATTSSVAAKITITEPDNNLVVGFDTKISILVAEKKNVLTIPVESLTISDEKTYVFVIENGVAVRKEISVGASSDSLYEVTKGLKEGDQVILNASKITEGSKVYAGA